MADYTTEIPQKGLEWPLGAVYCRHPTWTAEIDKWRLCREAHELTGGFSANLTKYLPTETAEVESSGSYLVPNIKETEGDYAYRVAMAAAPRFIQVGISSVVGKLCSTEVVRSEYPERILDWMQSVDSSGNSWAVWLSTICLPLLERYGCLYVFPRRPNAMVLTEAQREDLGLPEVTIEVLSPEVVEAWEVDQFGELVWLRYVEDIQQAQGPDGTQNKRILRHWYLTRLGWWAVDEIDEQESADPNKVKTGVVVKSGAWPDQLGYVPVVKWTLPAWPTYQAALSTLEYFRVASDMRRLETSTAFSMTWLPIEGRTDNPRTLVKGPDVVGTFPAESRHTPLMLTPDPAPFSHFMARLPKLEADALACFGLSAQSGGGGDSGVALAYIEGAADALYRSHSMACEASEHETLGVVAEMLSEDWDSVARGKWPMEFGTLSITKQLDDMTKVNDMQPPPEIKSLIISKAVSLVLPGLGADERQSIEDALDEEEKRSADAYETLMNPPPKMADESPAAAGGGSPTTLNPKEMADPARKNR